jgi:MarR family transcriptional regulator, transcriptional regulator for hemolysin
MASKPKKTEQKEVNPLRVGFLIHDVSRLRRTIYDQRLKPMGITRSQWWVLSNLSRHQGEGYMQIELARLLDVGKVTLGGLIDRLEENGFVTRVPDKIDRRSKRVLPSAKGKALIKKLEVIALGVNAEIMRGISEQEHKVLLNVLAKMKGNLIEMEAVPASTTGRKSRNGDDGED